MRSRNRDTRRAQGLRRKRRIRGVVQEYLETHPCVDCGESDPVVLEFDHVRGEKVMDIAGMKARAASLFTIDNEIAKCDVRCANCHRRKTAQEILARWEGHPTKTQELGDG